VSDDDVRALKAAGYDDAQTIELSLTRSKRSRATLTIGVVDSILLQKPRQLRMTQWRSRKPWRSGHAAGKRGAALIIAALLAEIAALAVAADTPVPAGETATPPATPADDTLQEIIVEEPEPRFVAPTLRDRIGRIWAPVLINGKGPFRLVLDTGSNSSVVNASVAAALGIPPRTENSVILRGVTGSSTVPVIAVDSLVAGELELRSKRLPIVSDAFGGAEGVLGTEGLLDKRIVIDFRHDMIKIVRSHSQRAPEGFLTIPVTIDQGLLLVANVRIGSLRAKAIIDTGGQATLANTALRDALPRRVRPEDVLASEVIGATLDVQRGDLVLAPLISLGGLEIRQASVTAGDMYIFQYWQMTKQPALLIGMDILGRFDTLIIDYKRRELQVRLRKRA
jgi:predicted aspartyl protease